jgi:PAS domain S-box-containing protein
MTVMQDTVMQDNDERSIFLSTLPATPFHRTLALAVVGVSAVLFACVVPFAGVPLAHVPAFVASYQSALAINDLITAILLYSQFSILRSRALLLLASGYLFTTLAAIVHALTFPGLFTPSGLFNAGSQTTVWLFMVWHGVFPILVFGYALLKDSDGGAKITGSSRAAIFWSVVTVIAAMAAFTAVVTSGHAILPVLLSEGQYTAAMIGVVTAIWSLSLAALVTFWFRRPLSVMDVWLMVVLCSWLFDIALSAIVNVARYDLGFYLGRLYGLCAASFVLGVLLVETGVLQSRMVRLLAAARRQAASALDQGVEERRRIFDTSQDLILVTDPTGNFVQVSPSSMTILGYLPEELIGHNADEFLYPDDIEANREEVRSTRRGKDMRNFETRYVHKNGQAVTLTCMGTWSEPVRRYFFVCRDLTEKQAAEAQLRHVQKMEAVGQLTGGVAHDFNNILTVITGTIEILAEGVADRPPLAAIARLIDEAAERGAELTRHLLAFARKQPLQPREIDVNALVIEATKLLRPTLGEHIEIGSLLADDAWPVLVDPGQLSTAILNLAINARDAMPGGGKLALETKNAVLDENYASMHNEVVAGDYVMVAVSDTGGGIPAENLERVFDPFFTTKELGKGTGLGLSMVYGFVKQSNGHIKIYSEEGHGTTVKVYLPRATGADQFVSEPAAAPRIEGGHEIVLVVEDDALVRKYVVAQIESLGYAALEASNAAAALVILNSNPAIDLLFTDVIMPGSMNGRQLVDEALKRRPTLKVLFTSGYTENAIIHHGRLDSGVLLLAKPYRKADLARMLRRAIDG